MRPGGPTGGADRADAHALFDALALLHVDAAQVRIDRRTLVAVLDLDDVAVAVLPAGEIDDAVADAAHRRAARRAIVDAFMLLPGLQDRMHAHRETGGHARELHRAGEKGAALALTVEIEIAALVIGILEPDGRKGLAVARELGSQQAARRLVPGDGLSVGGERFVDDAEGVAAHSNHAAGQR